MYKGYNSIIRPGNTPSGWTSPEGTDNEHGKTEAYILVDWRETYYGNQSESKYNVTNHRTMGEATAELERDKVVW